MLYTTYNNIMLNWIISHGEDNNKGCVYLDFEMSRSRFIRDVRDDVSLRLFCIGIL